MSPKTGYIYILSNKTRSVLYTGITSDLIKRIYDHRNGNGSCFTSKYNIKHLIYYEKYDNIRKAIEREKQLKNWNRKWKLDLAREVNPKLRDLWSDISTHPGDRLS